MKNDKDLKEIKEFITDKLNSRMNVTDHNSFMAGVNEGIRETCEDLLELIENEEG